MFSLTSLCKIFGAYLIDHRHLLPAPLGPRKTWTPEQLLPIAATLKGERTNGNLMSLRQLADAIGSNPWQLERAHQLKLIPAPVRHGRSVYWHRSQIDKIKAAVEQMDNRRDRPEYLLSHAELAAKIGVSRPTIDNWLRANIIPDLRVIWSSVPFWPEEVVPQLKQVADARSHFRHGAVPE